MKSGKTEWSDERRTINRGGAVAEWVRELALNGDRTFPAGFDSHCGRL